MADNESKFKSVKEYAGEQVLLSSNRLVFNARQDDILFSAKKYVNISAGEKITFDVGTEDTDNEQNIFLINAPKIQFGLEIKGKTVEPVTKADALEKVLNELIDAISAYSDAVTASVPPWSGLLSAASINLKAAVNQVKIQLNEPGNIKSDVTYTI